jgi:pantetheine-phosphate adenylyltransferase
MKAFEIGDAVLVGLSSDALVGKLSKPHITAPYEERNQELQAWLENLRLAARAEIVPLYDAFGTTIKDPDIEALVVSLETKPTAEQINERRRNSGLSPLEIVTIDMVPSENCAPISTTKIRRGEIDHEGRLLKKNSKQTLT